MHTEGDLAPTTGDAVPKAHGMQAVAAALGLYDPAKHATHVPPPFVAEPAEQGVHAEALSDPEGDV